MASSQEAYVDAGVRGGDGVPAVCGGVGSVVSMGPARTTVRVRGGAHMPSFGRCAHANLCLKFPSTMSPSSLGSDRRASIFNLDRSITALPGNPGVEKVIVDSIRDSISLSRLGILRRIYRHVAIVIGELQHPAIAARPHLGQQYVGAKFSNRFRTTFVMNRTG